MGVKSGKGTYDLMVPTKVVDLKVLFQEEFSLRRRTGCDEGSWTLETSSVIALRECICREPFDGKMKGERG